MTTDSTPLPPPKLAAANRLPPVLSLATGSQKGGLRPVLSVVLSLCLAAFFADGFVSLVSDSLLCFAHKPLLVEVQSMVGLLAVVLAFVVYGLMALTPMVPKRLFLPLTLFYPLAVLAFFPLIMLLGTRLMLIGWLVSVAQVLCGLALLRAAQGGWRPRWPLVPETQLGTRGFTWRNLIAFLSLNVFVFLPGTTIYLLFCASVAVSHYSAGFVNLKPSGMTVQVRKYVRPDGKTIQLVPMAHIGDAGFYQRLTASFPTNALILMEGVSDERDLLTNHITYERMASSLGLAEQQKEFKPLAATTIRADVDVAEFAPSTIGFLNLVMQVHGRGLNVRTVLELMQHSVPPEVQTQLWDDLLTKRNRRVFQEIQTRLPEADHLIVPWGAAHMPGIAALVQQAGFVPGEIQEFTVIRFGGPGRPRK